jgi:hypothetical protein
MVEPGSDRVVAPRDPAVRFDSLNGSLHEQLEYPQLKCG